MSAIEVVGLPDCGERLVVARNAAGEVEALASLLLRAANNDGCDFDFMALRGITIRIKALAGIVMSAVDDRNDPLSQLQYRLTGQSDHLAEM